MLVLEISCRQEQVISSGSIDLPAVNQIKGKFSYEK
jgi:hypothetical protein